MPTLGIVETLDVIEHVGLGLISRPIQLAGCSLGLQRGKETLHRGIVQDVAGAAHRAEHGAAMLRPIWTSGRALLDYSGPSDQESASVEAELGKSEEPPAMRASKDLLRCHFGGRNPLEFTQSSM